MIKYPILYKNACNEKNKDADPPKCILDCEEEVFEWILEPLTDNDKDLTCPPKTEH